MAYGIIGFSSPSKLAQPSGAVWGDCSAQEILDEGTGFFDYKDFKAALPLATAPNWNIDSGTFTYNSSYDSVISVTTGATSLDDAAIATRPLGPIVAGGGQKLWFEAAVSLASISAVQGVFVGVVNAAALSSKHLISVSSATKNNNLLGITSGGQSGYGFWLHPDAPTNFDAVWFNNIQTALTPTTVGTAGASGSGSTYTNSGLVLASVLTANANTPDQANVNAIPLTPPGVLVATNTSTVNSLTPQQLLAAQDPNTNPATYLPNSVPGASGFIKLGIRYDGQQYLYYYVNGTAVAKIAINTNQDQTSDFAGVVQIQALGTGQPVLNVLFERTAALLQP